MAKTFLQTGRRLVPSICLAVFAFLLPLSSFIPIGQPFVSGVLQMYVTPGLFATDIGVAAIFIGFLFRRNRYQRLNKFFHGIFWPLAAIAFLALITSPFSLVPNLAWYSTFRWLLAVVVFLLLFYIDIPIKNILVIILASLAVQALIGVGQAIAQQPLGLPGEMTLPLQNPDAAAIHITGNAWLRSYGLTFNPNVLGGYLMSAVLLLLLWINRRALQVVWLIFAAGLFLTFSRSAWMAAVVILPFLFWWYSRRSPIIFKRMVPGIIMAVAGGIILLILFFPQIVFRLNPAATLFTSLRGRGEMIDIALNSIKSDPLTGLGAGNFPVAMKSFISLDPPQYVHNVVLLLAAEIGIGGGIIWLWLWIFPMAMLEPRLRQKNPWPIIITVTWFGWGLIGLWDSYPWALETGRLYSVTLLALIARVNQTENNDGS